MKSIQEVKDLMESSESEQEWNDNCDKVKKRFNGYPPFWYGEIILGGILQKSQLKW